MYGVDLLSIDGDRLIDIKGVASDSRKTKDGFLFIAVKGTIQDGHDFIGEAISGGAVAVICEKLPAKKLPSAIYITSTNSRKALGLVSSNFHGNPSKKLKLVGITGTNGKTTVATLLYELFQQLHYKAGLISTVENKINEIILPTRYTTPDPITLHELLAEMVVMGCTHCFMEVSSHALSQDRVKGIHFQGAVFTNISHDHLDYHVTFDDYITAKKILFDELKSHAFALTNIDDKRGRVMLQNTKARKYSYSLKSVSEFKAKILTDSIAGLQLDIDDVEVWFHLIGKFNAYNLLAVYSVAVLLEEEPKEVLGIMSGLLPVRGRFEKIINHGGILAIVDYAHTPDALGNVINTINGFRTKNEKFITVIGCGGDRDKDKRPVMGRIATKNTDKVIFTSDNPRTENPEMIIDDIMKGVPVSLSKNVMRVTDRKEAIRVACNLASKGDIILVAGKGHEVYQEIDGNRIHFDDKEYLEDFLSVQ